MNIQKIIFLLSIFTLMAAINAMEPDNSSPRNPSQASGNRILFRAINNISSPMTQSQSISNSAPLEGESLSADMPDRALDKIDIDLGELAIDPNAMDN